MNLILPNDSDQPSRIGIGRMDIGDHVDCYFFIGEVSYLTTVALVKMKDFPLRTSQATTDLYPEVTFSKGLPPRA